MENSHATIIQFETDILFENIDESFNHLLKLALWDTADERSSNIITLTAVKSQ
jgi:hypothetical protein